MQQTDEDRHKSELMSARLVDLKSLCVRIGIKLGLTLDDARDVYGDVCIYMLSRGVKLINLEHDFDAAIVQTMKRRTSNHKRNHRRIDYDYIGVMQQREHLAAKDEIGAIDWAIDCEALTHELIKRCTTDAQRELARVYLKRECLIINEEAKRTGYNKHTMHGAGRWLKARLREMHDEQEQIFRS